MPANISGAASSATLPITVILGTKTQKRPGAPRSSGPASEESAFLRHLFDITGQGVVLPKAIDDLRAGQPPASIVEKETGRADERPRVAGVFVNRLARNIPLQSDPTIVYGLVGGKGTLGRGILKSEVEQKTPYNTYTIVGLPPGPIANPGRAALEAVASPSRTKDLYFVADGTGGHAFAEWDIYSALNQISP